MVKKDATHLKMHPNFEVLKCEIFELELMKYDILYSSLMALIKYNFLPCILGVRGHQCYKWWLDQSIYFCISSGSKLHAMHTAFLSGVN